MYCNIVVYVQVCTAIQLFLYRWVLQYSCLCTAAYCIFVVYVQVRTAILLFMYSCVLQYSCLCTAVYCNIVVYVQLCTAILLFLYRCVLLCRIGMYDKEDRSRLCVHHGHIRELPCIYQVGNIQFIQYIQSEYIQYIQYISVFGKIENL